MFDNTNFPWVSSRSTEIRTVGDMLREAGYYTAYNGKWHLTKEFETVNKLGTPTKIFTQEMEAYGFSDYFGVGDIIAHHQGGYLHDGVIAAMGVSWLRGRGTVDSGRQTKRIWCFVLPFFLIGTSKKILQNQGEECKGFWNRRKPRELIRADGTGGKSLLA